MTEPGEKKPESALAYGLKSAVVVVVITIVVVAAFVFGLVNLLH
jgi:hypothetical protein